MDISTDLYKTYNPKNKFNQDKYFLDYELNDIIKQDYLDYKVKDVSKKYDVPNLIQSFQISSDPYMSPQIISGNKRAISWGRDAGNAEPRAYIQPTQEDVERVLAAIHMVASLPADQQRQVVEATREIRYFVDGQIRARFGATNHFNAIRCLNNPQRTNVDSLLSMRGVQLAGEEYFGLNRFMENFPDIADIQWWALYQNGSWHLDTWNPEGEHLDTGVNGWGNLVGSVLKVNGRVLEPQEIVAFYRSMRLRNERGFMNTILSVPDLKYSLTMFNSDQSRPLLERVGVKGTDGLGFFNFIKRDMPNQEQQIEIAIDLGLVDGNGKTLTYTGKSMLDENVTALQRRARQENESDPEVRRIIHPIIFN